MPNFTFYGGRKQAMALGDGNIFFFLLIRGVAGGWSWGARDPPPPPFVR